MNLALGAKSRGIYVASVLASAKLETKYLRKLDSYGTTRMRSLELFRTDINTVSYKAGDIIFEQAEPGHTMYLVKERRVNMQVGDSTVNSMGPGEIFGEMALISNDPRSATAVAATDCTVLPVDEERFLFVVQQTPYFSLHIMSVLADRLREQVKPSDN
jgi:CRP/FNR family cyclic AMP-dependent transcriptional regulator